MRGLSFNDASCIGRNQIVRIVFFIGLAGGARGNCMVAFYVRALCAERPRLSQMSPNPRRKAQVKVRRFLRVLVRVAGRAVSFLFAAIDYLRQVWSGADVKNFPILRSGCLLYP